MSISRRRDGRWCVKFKDTSGVWKQKSFKGEDEARQFDAEMQYDAPENTRLTVLDAIILYLRNHSLTENSRNEYARLVRPGRRGRKDGYACFLSNKFVDELNRRDLENLRGAMRDAGVSAATINLNVGRLSAAFSYAAEEDIIEKNPWKKYRNLPAHHKSRAPSSFDDVVAVYKVLPSWAQWVCKTAIALCLRPGECELTSLTWKAFNWRRGYVDVFMPKTNRGKRVFPPAWYIDEAKEHAMGKSLDAPVCVGRKGQPLSYNTFRAAWYRACKRIKLSLSPYAMRHFAASIMVARGQDIQSVAAQLGHSDVATTAKFYLHTIEPAQRKAGAAIPAPDDIAIFGAGIC